MKLDLREIEEKEKNDLKALMNYSEYEKIRYLAARQKEEIEELRDLAKKCVCNIFGVNMALILYGLIKTFL